MPRDRFATRAVILESAAAIVAAEGVAGIGVNSLAEAARCDKVLIYRYFGGLDKACFRHWARADGLAKGGAGGRWERGG